MEAKLIGASAPTCWRRRAPRPGARWRPSPAWWLPRRRRAWRPVAVRDAVGAEEGDVGTQVARAPRRCRPRRRRAWSGGPARAAGAARSGVAGQSCGDRDRMGETTSRWSRGSTPARRASWNRRRGAPASPAAGSRSTAAAGDPFLLRGVERRRARTSADSMTAERCRRGPRPRGPGVPDPSVQGGQVSTDGLGGDVVRAASTVTDRRPRSATAGLWPADALRRTWPPDRPFVVDLCICCFTPECVDCQGFRAVNL